MKCKKCGCVIMEAEGKRCPYCGHWNGEDRLGALAGSQSNGAIPDRGNSGESHVSMTWYHILKVILWIGAILNVVTGFMYMNGSVYQGMAESVYDRFPLLETWDVFYGIALLGLSAFTIYVWYQLHNFKLNGPRQLTGLYLFNIGYLLIYSSGASIIMQMNLMSQSTNMFSLLGSIAMTIVNHIYFKNRSDLFVN